MIINNGHDLATDPWSRLSKGLEDETAKLARCGKSYRSSMDALLSGRRSGGSFVVPNKLTHFCDRGFVGLSGYIIRTFDVM